MTIAYIALGSNLQNPTEQLHNAIAAIAELTQTIVLKTSSFYWTKPVGFDAQPDFLNAVIKIETKLNPIQLLTELFIIEKKQGRVRAAEKNGPRTLDLDLLLHGDSILNSPELILPHPRMKERSFVLVPLKEIAPHLVLPTGEEISKL